ncbi:MAG: phospholipase D family protein, partial [Microbacteriaceae bacterium]|nr:phospholipase D family protein [Burkholderiaceae bacterium]
MHPSRPRFELPLRWLTLLLAVVVSACAGLPPHPGVQPVLAIPASAATELGRVAAQMNAARDGQSSVRPLIQAAFALDARIELIRRAQASVDVQTYLLADDKTGRLILRELRDAARRGVRVRLLLDDFYTTHLDPLLLGLATEPNVEVRLFNPFVNGRGNGLARWSDFFADFHRLNHRMHNKLFVADGAMAIAGGRNLADEYFLRSEIANFIDFELAMAGPVVPQLATIFDQYWNSTVVYPLATVVVRSDPADSLRSAFDAATTGASTPPPAPLDETDLFGDPPLGEQLRTGRLPWIRAEANAMADSPTKALGDDPLATESLAQLTMGFFAQAHSEINIVSPYFIPGDLGVARMQALRERGIKITVMTNSLADSDEPLVNINYNRYRVALLRAGVDLYEVSTRQLKRSGNFRPLLKQARGQLHAKLALIDREWVLLGSMNLDPRSARLNTELGVRVHSRELTHALIYAYNLDDIEGV